MRDAAADDEHDRRPATLIARKARRDRWAAAAGHIGADLVGGLEGNAIALTEVGDGDGCR